MFRGRKSLIALPPLCRCPRLATTQPATPAPLPLLPLPSLRRRYTAVGSAASRGASAEGTKAYFARQRERDAQRKAGASVVAPAAAGGWTISRVGFGGSRAASHKQRSHVALKKALRLGCNVVETGAVYGDGESELLFGQVLSEAFEQQELSRDQVVVLGKAGLLTKQTLARMKKQASENETRYRGLTEVSPNYGFCMDPIFLEEQLTGSLQRLGLDAIDVFFLHNPEMFLERHPDRAEEFYGELSHAFRQLEKEASRGRIQYYGISSSSGLTLPSNSPQHISLERVLDVAQSVASGPRHHFAAVQYPFNLRESEALFLKNCCNNTLSVAEFAKQKELVRFSHRPLNAYVNGQVLRLVSFPTHEEKDMLQLLKEAFDYTIHLEREYPGSDPAMDPDRKLPPPESVLWGHILASNREQLTSIHAWTELLENQILPTAMQAFDQISSEQKHFWWISKYKIAFNRLIERFTWMLEANASARSLSDTQLLERECKELSSPLSLQQKAMSALLSTASPVTPADCVLVGMRKDEYVRELLMTLPATVEPVQDQQSLHRLFEAFKPSSKTT
ncbi:Aldo/keto reductase [Balamuthia mandrillaris]